MRWRGRLWWLAVTGIAWILAAPAMAQQVRDYYPRDRSLSVTERPHPELDPLGLPAGSFLIFPTLTAGIGYDDNIYALPDHPVGDWIATIGGDVALRSRWSHHAVNVHAGAVRHQYLSRDRESTTDYDLGADGRLDIGNGDIALSAQHARMTQSRSDVDAPNGNVRPIRFHRNVVAVSGEQEFGRLKIAGDADWQRFRYADARSATGAILGQKYRDRDETTQTLRIDYATGPRLAFYVAGSANQRAYRRDPTGAPSRNSHGFTIEGGADFDITNLVRGHVQVGYLSQTASARGWSTHGVSGRGKVEWYATPLLTVTLEGGRRIADSAEFDAPAYLATDVTGRIDYELLRSLVISASGGIEWDRFQASDQRARRTQASLSARYRMGRLLELDGSFEHLNQSASGAPGLRGFTDNRLMLTLLLRK